MYPSVHIFGRVIPSYGICGVTGWLLGLAFILLRSENRKKADDAVYIYAIGSVGMVIGAKLLYLIVNAGRIAEKLKTAATAGIPLMTVITAHLTGGMVFYGGLFGAAAAAFGAARYFNCSLRDHYAALVPVMPLLAAFGRIGCFLTGCCYGCEYHGPGAVIFQHSPCAPNGIPLFPTQPAEAAFDAALFVTAVIMTKTEKYRSRALKLYLGLYAGFRFLLEFFRGDAERGIWIGLSLSQYISVCLLGLVLLPRIKEFLRHFPQCDIF